MEVQFMVKTNIENPKSVIKEMTQKLKFDNINNLSDLHQLVSQGKDVLKKYYTYDDKLIIDLQYELAKVLNYIGWYSRDVERLMKNSIPKYIKLYGAKHPGLSKFYFLWASALNDSGKYKKALLLIEQARNLCKGCKNKHLIHNINTRYYYRKLESLGGLKNIEEAKIVYEEGLKNIKEGT
jgi:tetratricopeptide (TPR) repeat protein